MVLLEKTFKFREYFYNIALGKKGRFTLGNTTNLKRGFPCNIIMVKCLIRAAAACGPWKRSQL